MFHCKEIFPSHVAFHLNRIFIEPGPPNRLQTDNGSEFKKGVINVNKYNLYITFIFGKHCLCIIFFKGLFSQTFFQLNTHRRFNDLQILKNKNFPYSYNLLNHSQKNATFRFYKPAKSVKNNWSENGKNVFSLLNLLRKYESRSI